jgi:hypothetical protein
MKKKKNPFKDNKHEIYYNMINAGIAGIIALIGSCADGNLTSKGVIVALLTGLLVAIIKFRDYWESEKEEYCKDKKGRLLTFY